MVGLDEILALTDRVEQHVERGEWGEAQGVDAERCRLLGQLFSDPAAQAHLGAHRGVLEDLLLRNQRTLQRVRSCQEQLGQASAALTRAHGAMRAYEHNSGTANLVYLNQRRMMQT